MRSDFCQLVLEYLFIVSSRNNITSWLFSVFFFFFSSVPCSLNGLHRSGSRTTPSFASLQAGGEEGREEEGRAENGEGEKKRRRGEGGEMRDKEIKR